MRSTGPARSPDPLSTAPDAANAAADDRGGPSGRAIVATIAAIAVVVVLAFFVGRLTAPTVVTPSDGSAEAGFARDMQTHHLQGVELALLVHDRTDDDTVRLLATDMITAQSSQAGQLYGLLVEWGLDQVGGEPSMTWMTRPAPDEPGAHGAGHPTHEPGARMPGLATPEQVAELTAAEGTAADRIFFELMIDHHAGGVEMARAVLARSDQPSIRTVARGIVAAQESEIALMEDLLEKLPAS